MGVDHHADVQSSRLFGRIDDVDALSWGRYAGTGAERENLSGEVGAGA